MCVGLLEVEAIYKRSVKGKTILFPVVEINLSQNSFYRVLS